MPTSLPCPNCETRDLEVFFRQQGVPTNSCLLFASKSEAQGWRRGEIQLGFCRGCGFISNTAFDPRLTEYSQRYEETQGFSATFRSFHERLAQDLIERHDLRRKNVLEIGCGKGEFLELLCRLGGNAGVGFDPGYHEGRLDSSSTRSMTVIRDFYSEKYADYFGDFVCCKMTLEHIANPPSLLAPLQRAAKKNRDAVLFFQVPESMRIFRTCAFEDVYYEHCSYFTAASFAALFRRHGFEPSRIATEYSDQYLTLEAVAAEKAPRAYPEESLQELSDCVGSYGERCQERILSWRSRIVGLAGKQKTVVLWGSGSKAVAFLTTVGVGEQIGYVVDINPHKHGHFLAGTGQEIIAPEALKEIKPDMVIVMNRVYVPEIRELLQSMALAPEVVAL